MQRMKNQHIQLTVDGVSLRLMTQKHEGFGPPLVFLHGFGSTKEDFANAGALSGLEGRASLAYDAPGFGGSECADLGKLSMAFLSRTAEAIIEQCGLEPVHLIGHSMGGLTALLVADAIPSKVLSFVNIEGNLAPEDCFLSRQIIEYPNEDDRSFLDHFAERVRNSADVSSAYYAENLHKNVCTGAVTPIFRSMVELTDTCHLMATFLNLPMPKLFVYGDGNQSLSYLARLARSGVELTEIPNSGHFPMYANPSALWKAIGQFIDNVEKE